jgi:hypothetical protein
MYLTTLTLGESQEEEHHDWLPFADEETECTVMVTQDKGSLRARARLTPR